MARRRSSSSALGLGATLLSFRWKDGVWEQQLLYGLPITLALVGLIALLVDGLALIPYQFPNSYYLWVGLVVLALVVGIIGWRRFRNWRRVVSVLSVVLSAAMAWTLINKQYQYYPTLGSLFGVNAQNQVSLKQLQDIRDRGAGRQRRRAADARLHHRDPDSRQEVALRRP